MSATTPAEPEVPDIRPADATPDDIATSVLMTPEATPADLTADPLTPEPTPADLTPELAPPEAENAPVRTAARPRIRWGAIVWGLIVCAIAAATLQVTRASESREGFALWLTQLTPGGIWLIVVLLAGGILLLLGLLAVIRRAQRSR